MAAKEGRKDVDGILRRERREKKMKKRAQERWWGRGSCAYHVVEVVGAFQGT